MDPPIVNLFGAKSRQKLVLLGITGSDNHKHQYVDFGCA
jgi:hypothetical protein